VKIGAIPDVYYLVNLAHKPGIQMGIKVNETIIER